MSLKLVNKSVAAQKLKKSLIENFSFCAVMSKYRRKQSRKKDVLEYFLYPTKLHKKLCDNFSKFCFVVYSEECRKTCGKKTFKLVPPIQNSFAQKLERMQELVLFLEYV